MIKKLANRWIIQIGNIKKNFHTSSIRNVPKDKKIVREIKIPVPWGHIAGKWWGDINEQPIIALHGVQDNAATFDKLIPKLKVSNILALDLPGHGHSSHLPYGITIHFLDNVTFMRYLLNNYFKWKNLKLLGHSFGSSVWFAYASLYPKDVKKFISIDCGRHNLVPIEDNFVSEYRMLMDWQLKCESLVKKEPPNYTMEELLDLVEKGRKGSMPLSREACRVILSRGTAVSSNCELFHLSRDIRLKQRAFGRMSLGFLLAMADRMEGCEVLFIRAKQGILEPGPKLDGYLQTLERTKLVAKRFESHEVDGTHHLHLEDPDSVAPIINSFLIN